MAEFLPFEARIARAWPPERWNEVTILIGLSGGADSVALLRALCRIRGSEIGRIVAAHFNHRWRGEESNEDARFCLELCNSLGIDCIVGQASPSPNRLKTEDAARKDRYVFFRRTADRVGARYLVLAHHRDDQVETVLQRLIRGTSLRGLGGMPRVRRLSELTSLVRPMLSCPRRAIKKYLMALNQPFRTDSTNANPAWLRNRIRAELIPLLEANYAHQSSRSIARLAAESAEAAAFLEGVARRVMEETVKFDVAGGGVRLSNYEGLHLYILRLVLMQIWKTMNWPEGQMTRRHWRKLAEDLACKKNGSLGQYPGAIHVSIVNEVVYLARR
jgi:tRNA(Ile)-lysidine synthase